MSSCTCRWCVSLLLALVGTLALFWWRNSSSDNDTAIFGAGGVFSAPFFHKPRNSRSREEVLHLLQEKGIYDTSDFKNEFDVVVPYWWNAFDNSNSTKSPKHHTRIPRATTTPEWGPCFAPHEEVDWDTAIAKTEQSRTPKYEKNIVARVNNLNEEDLAGFCRPGFIIIGAGKCGTSSLYHYLTDHPRVLPASQKQIHYFKYYPERTMKWYLHHFPTTTSFLSSGALLTGEASPGYLPYPDVARLVHQRMGEGPRIIVVGREPVDRAYSSYRYNYVYPTVEAMQRGRVKGIDRGKSDDYYEKYLFSFEDMMRAELNVLRECLSAPMGSSVKGARDAYGSKPWAQHEFERRQKQKLPPLVDLDGFCYGEAVDQKVLRRQWTELVEQYPEKVIIKKNVHLQQSFIGRGLYTLPLEWWYVVYKPSDIYFVCTEEMRDMSGAPLNRLGQFLGLSSYNFSRAVSKGAYNVGGHRGYDKETSWTEIQEEENGNATEISVTSKEIPLSDEFRKELDEFIRPYNERLFKLVGRRCDW